MEQKEYTWELTNSDNTISFCKIIASHLHFSSDETLFCQYISICVAAHRVTCRQTERRTNRLLLGEWHKNVRHCFYSALGWTHLALKCVCVCHIWQPCCAVVWILLNVSLLHAKRLWLTSYCFFPPPVTVQNTICSNTRSCSPEDGHSDARNMLR